MGKGSMGLWSFLLGAWENENVMHRNRSQKEKSVWEGMCLILVFT